MPAWRVRPISKRSGRASSPAASAEAGTCRRSPPRPARRPSSPGPPRADRPAARRPGDAVHRRLRRRPGAAQASAGRVRARDGPGDRGLRWLLMAWPAAHEVWDDESWDQLTTRAVTLARDAGALTVLPVFLLYRAAVHIYAGEFAAASVLNAEADAIVEATGNTRWQGTVAAARRLARPGRPGAEDGRRQHPSRHRAGRGQGDLHGRVLEGGPLQRSRPLSTTRSPPPSGPASTRTSACSAGRSPSSSRRPSEADGSMSPPPRWAGSKHGRAPRARTGRSASKPGRARSLERRRRCRRPLPRGDRAARPHPHRRASRPRPAPVRRVAASREPPRRRARAIARGARRVRSHRSGGVRRARPSRAARDR